MNGNGLLREEKKIEYQIRKYQRALTMIQRTDYKAGDYCLLYTSDAADE